MNLVSVLLTAFALSMDAFAVSVTKGMILKKINYSISCKIAIFFGFFQGVMPLIGWCLGIQFESYIKSFDHWIAFILLSFIGLKMIFDSKDDKSENNSFNLNNKELLILSIATSIDALAIGVSFAFLNVNIIPICISIAIITFSMCFLGVLIGKKIGSIFKTYAQILGGVLLILIGLNILNDHTGIISNIL
ncbi:manganese efflux pump MntP family protein [Romboutsia lituseburensis]|uniref:manganese efflux pump MntP n=1 Tax=Romboutsia lituseburensis TaxID=1537 RepID=UPI00215B4F00|nr:manganese efflux pump MntP family protein [Romboutsia lituseburensis]MCR8744976.1 manganese efflux pump MntP family protein [Romboutsia lituseburensis]